MRWLTVLLLFPAIVVNSTEYEIECSSDYPEAVYKLYLDNEIVNESSECAFSLDVTGEVTAEIVPVVNNIEKVPNIVHIQEVIKEVIKEVEKENIIINLTIIKSEASE